MRSIFTDSGQILEDFAERMDVSCPMCHRRACVMRISADEKELFPGGGSGAPQAKQVVDRFHLQVRRLT